MFFYASLFVASLIVALVLLWLYRVIADVGKAVYRAILPSSRGDARDQRRPEKVLHTGITHLPTPWGWGGHSSPSQAARATKIAPPGATPWGWPGSERKPTRNGMIYNLTGGAPLTDPIQKKTQVAGATWPYREEKFDFAGKSYKVTRKSTPKKTNLSHTDKPWGW